MPKVIFFTNLASELALQVIAPAPREWDVSVQPFELPAEEKASLASDADFLILFPGELDEAVLRAAESLKLVQLVSAGFDRMPLDVLSELEIPLANNGGTNSIDVAEHTLALILSVYRRLTEMDRNVRNDGWKEIDSGMTTFTVHGKTVGIVGLGHIGKEVAKRLVPFQANVIYFDPFPVPDAVERDLQVERVPLGELLERSDIVTLHVPLNDQTHHLIGPEELARMKSSAILVNTCRGPVVDEDALTEALTSGKIQAAGLDVLKDEPTDPGNPILQLDNVILSPHIAGVTYDTWQRRGVFIFENLRRVWAGEDPLSEIVL
ncbi:MAG: lactate dehydrogenase [Caldilineaceae bacterium SB0670_bin_27]|uniref:Lactate dehydrogenase n=1 Tax=Caldilineaceae bacterium SB0664_bin_27 TaxID=2605260 RepID=A0A6B0YVF6_9CHLR|nr:lactate dehydrogenase [Caldilineaceae bacterium SB0664_bin_27]MYJ79808.1 lactate dehydrogenase [Caldilineaceae bacterium SB0670_bin_27]